MSQPEIRIHPDQEMKFCAKCSQYSAYTADYCIHCGNQLSVSGVGVSATASQPRAVTIAWIAILTGIPLITLMSFFPITDSTDYLGSTVGTIAWGIAVFGLNYVILIGGLAYLGRHYSSSGRNPYFLPRAIAIIVSYFLVSAVLDSDPFAAFACFIAVVIILVQARKTPARATSARKMHKVFLYILFAALCLIVIWTIMWIVILSRAGPGGFMTR